MQKLLLTVLLVAFSASSFASQNMVYDTRIFSEPGLVSVERLTDQEMLETEGDGFFVPIGLAAGIGGVSSGLAMAKQGGTTGEIAGAAIIGAIGGLSGGLAGVSTGVVRIVTTGMAIFYGTYAGTMKASKKKTTSKKTVGSGG